MLLSKRFLRTNLAKGKALRRKFTSPRQAPHHVMCFLRILQPLHVIFDAPTLPFFQLQGEGEVPIAMY